MRLFYSFALVAFLAGCASPAHVAAPVRPAAPPAAADTRPSRAETDRLAAEASARAAEAVRAAEADAVEEAARQQAQADAARAADLARLRYAHGSVNVRSAPSTSGARVAQLAQGGSVFVEACASGWCRVMPAAEDATWAEGYVSEPLLHASAAAGPAAVRSSREASRSTRSSSTPGRSARSSGRSAVCADYPSQAAAQIAFNRDPVGLSELDGDRDGEACETQFRSRRARSTARTRTRAAAPSRTCYTGPRGGRYYINSNGNKVYGC